MSTDEKSIKKQIDEDPKEVKEEHVDTLAESDADTTIVTDKPARVGGAVPEGKAAKEEENIGTAVTRSKGTGPPVGAPEVQSSAAPPSMSPPEKDAKSETVPKVPAKSPPTTQPGMQKTSEEKKGASMKHFLIGILLLLALGASAFALVQKMNQSPEAFSWLPFKWGGQNQQAPGQTGFADGQMGASRGGASLDGTGGVSTTPPTSSWPPEGATQTVQGQSTWDRTPSYSAPQDNQPGQGMNPSGSDQSLSPGAAAGPQGGLPATALDYNQIQVGMSPDLVSQILGEPSQVKTVGQMIEWEYDTGTGFFEVRFQNGRVAYKGTTPYHASRSSQTPPPSMTPGAGSPYVPGGQGSSSAASQDFDQIQVGMSSDVVRQILGEPSQVKKVKQMIEWEYDSPQGTFEVRLRNDKVVYRGLTPKHGTKSGQAPYSSTAPGTDDSFTPGGRASSGDIPESTRQVQMGMTTEEVRQLMGNPGRVKQLGRKVEWEYFLTGGLFEVQFEKNRVVNIRKR